MQKKSGKHSFLLRLSIYFLVVSLVPIVIFSLITSNITRREAFRNMEERITVTIAGMQSELENEFEQMAEAGAALAQDPEVIGYVSRKENRPNEALYRLYALTSGSSRVSTTHVVSAQYQKGISTTEVPKGYLPRFNRGWGIFAKADEARDTVFRVNDHNQNMIYGVSFSVATPVIGEGGDVCGYVVQDVYQNMANDAIRKYNLEQGQIIYLEDENHFLIYSNDRSFDIDRLNRLPEILRDRKNGYLSTESGSVYVDRTKPGRSGIRVVTMVPIRGILETSSIIRTAALWAGILCTLLCVIVSVIAYTYISEPVKKLTDAFSSLKDGKLDTRIEDTRRNDEFGQLEDGFNVMAGKLEELIQSTEEKQERLRMAQSSALQAQINPHFLYNTLDLIKWNAKLGNNEEVSKIAVLLGKLLRSMADFEHDIVTVEEELKLIDRYLEIQKIHHGDGLEISKEADDRTLGLYIPKLIVQPLVENAVVHGIDPAKKTNRISIRAELYGMYLRFVIRDSGHGMNRETLEKMLAGELTGRTGIGLANVRKRSALYGDENCGVFITSEPGLGTEVVLVIRPLEQKEGTGNV